MKIPDIDQAKISAATAGDLAAIDALLAAIQGGIFNLALRMLGNRDDASDATQEILLKVVTHLASFRGEAAFSTWTYRIARNHLLTAITRSREHPAVSLDALHDRLQTGLDYADAHNTDQSLTPEDKAAARQVALGCTQGMLMALDREQRLAFVLDAVFGLNSDEAASVLDITAAAYRKRLSRAKQLLDPFFRRTCGLANAEARCRCERQLPALRSIEASEGNAQRIRFVAHREELAEAEVHFSALLRMSDAVAIFRAHPEYRVPTSMVPAIRAVLKREGYWRSDALGGLQ